MAFLSRFSNLLKPLGSKHVRIGLCSSNSPLFLSTKSMSAARLFIGGLAYAMDESDLKEVFQQYGSLIEVKIVTDRDSGRSRGFGFVTYISGNAASNALWDMDGKVLWGRRINVSLAHQQFPRPSVGVDGCGFEVDDCLYDSDYVPFTERLYGKNSPTMLYGFDLYEELMEEWKDDMKPYIEEVRRTILLK